LGNIAGESIRGSCHVPQGGYDEPFIFPNIVQELLLADAVSAFQIEIEMRIQLFN
jgi:hypothetical protein